MAKKIFQIDKVFTLTDYLKENKDILVILGIFITITALSANLSIKLVAALISFASFTCSTIILIEFWRKSLRKGRRVSMSVYFFRFFLFLLAFGFFSYWFIIVDAIYPDTIIFMLLTLILMELFRLGVKQVKNILVKRAHSKGKEIKISKSITLIIVIIVILLSLAISRFIANKINLPVFKFVVQVVSFSTQIKGPIQ
jgi:hypothetical protein